MSPSRIVFVVLLFAALLVPITPAHAASSVLCTGYNSCADKSYSSFGYSTAQNTSYWRMYTGTNCTNYVAYRLVTTGGMPNARPASGVGNAQDWGTAMSSVTDATPAVGSVAWWGRTGRHVAYVESVVSPTEIVVSESNWSGAFDWRRITKTGSGWPDGFIHFADRTLSNSAAPYISGEVKVGNVVRAGAGTWTPKGNTFTYQWLANGAAISGADEKTLAPTSDLLGKKLSFIVTASKPSYPTVMVTAPPIAVAAGTISPTAAPTISGAAVVDSAVRASPGSWSPAPTSYAYQWSVNGVPVAGATAAAYTPPGANVGKTLTVTSTAGRRGYTPQSATSVATSPIARGTLKAVTAPSVTGGIPTVGVPLTASPGTYSPARTTMKYQWIRTAPGNPAPTAIAGAVGATYVPTASDVGAALGVRVTARRVGYEPVTAPSPLTSTVRPGSLTSTAPPTIAGTARVGAPLRATPGRWSHAVDTTFQWYSSNGPIAAATSSTYTPTASLRGDRIRVRVTARRPGYTTAVASSVRTLKVTAGRITMVTAPRISGSLTQGSVLRVVRGEATPSTANVRYQWLRDGEAIPGATGSGHRINPRDAGRRLSVRVTATARGYDALIVDTRGRRASN